MKTETLRLGLRSHVSLETLALLLESEFGLNVPKLAHWGRANKKERNRESVALCLCRKFSHCILRRQLFLHFLYRGSYASILLNCLPLAYSEFSFGLVGKRELTCDGSFVCSNLTAKPMDCQARQLSNSGHSNAEVGGRPARSGGRPSFKWGLDRGYARQANFRLSQDSSWLFGYHSIPRSSGLVRRINELVAAA